MAPVYDLYAVINHMGASIAQGHYTANCKLEDGSWASFNDSYVCSISSDRVVTADAYVCLFKKRSAAPQKDAGLTLLLHQVVRIAGYFHLLGSSAYARALALGLRAMLSSCVCPLHSTALPCTALAIVPIALRVNTEHRFELML